ADLLKKALGKRKDYLAVHVGLSFDETARLCHWHLPQSHYLEAWGDAVAFDGSASVIQPLIKPLYEPRSALEAIPTLTRRVKPKKKDTKAPDEYDYDTRDPMQIVKDHWRARHKGDGKFDDYWQTSLHDGVLAGTKPKAETPAIAPGLFAKEEMKFVPVST